MDGLNEMEIRLWEYIDGLADERQRSAVEDLIAGHAEWRAKYAELMETHRLLLQAELEEPSMRFSRNVMEAIAREQIAPAARSYINKRVVQGIAALFFVLIAGVLAYGLGGPAGPESGGGSVLGRLPEISFRNSWVNMFVMVNMLLGLLLLDRYLSGKRERAPL